MAKSSIVEREETFKKQYCTNASNKILFLDSPSFAKEDIKEAFQRHGFEIIDFYNDSVYNREDASFDGWFEKLLKREDYAFVFSFNYYPLLSKGCDKLGVCYVSYVYDSPHVALYSTTILNSCNAVFLFDKETYLELRQGGIDTVHYLPLAANVKRLDSLVVPSSAMDRVCADVSFVGSMYDEGHNLFDRMAGLDDYTTGYLDALLDAQMRVQGYSFVEEVLSPEIISAMQKCLPYAPQPDGVESLSYFYSQYVIDRKLTSLERKHLLKKVSEQFPLKLYTHNPPKDMPKAEYIGAIDWEESMPAVFRYSKINLNISLRSIRSGIPLRAFDIMGAGGFLLTNYQADFFDYFVAGEDFVYYESEADLLHKINYYLTHEEERKQIAKNGHDKVKQQHTFHHRVEEMLKIIGVNA